MNIDTSKLKMKGKRGPASLLTEEQMKNCVILKNQGYSLDSIADSYSVNRSTVVRAIEKMKKLGFIGI